MQPDPSTARGAERHVCADGHVSIVCMQFTSKLESMFNDIKTSRDTMAGYKQHSATGPSASDRDIDLSVQVRRQFLLLAES